MLQDNIEDLKTTRKVIDKMFLSDSGSIFVTAVSIDNKIIINLSAITSVFINFFDKVIVDFKYHIRFTNISLNVHKSDGPSSIPNRISKLFNNDVSDRLVAICNPLVECFLSVKKLSKTEPV